MKQRVVRANWNPSQMVNTKDLPAEERSLSSREAMPITEALPSPSRSIWKVISRWQLPLHSHQDLPLIVTRRAAHSCPSIPQWQPLTTCQCISSFQKCYCSFELNCAHIAAAFQILISHTVINSPFVNFYFCPRSMKSEKSDHAFPSCTLWHRMLFQRRLKNGHCCSAWARWRVCGEWRNALVLEPGGVLLHRHIPPPCSWLILISPASFDVSKTILFGQ